MFTFKTNDQALLLSLCKTAAKNDTRDLSGLDIMRDCFFFKFEKLTPANYRVSFLTKHKKAGH